MRWNPLLPIGLPAGLGEFGELIVELTNDLRWSWSHAGDALWARLEPDVWERTLNPYAVLQNVSLQRLRALGEDTAFVDGLRELSASHKAYLEESSWSEENFKPSRHGHVAYFSMEFGLGKALPLYAGGLGVLAGDHLKAASDLGVPLLGVGLLYQQGYFRQVVNAAGEQTEIYTYLDPSSRPVTPVLNDDGAWRHVTIRLPGRKVRLRVWMAQVGRVPLYLLDSNDPLNTPADRGITSMLYGGSEELRLAQEIVLGVGGWGLVESLGEDVSVCHLNEGHAAFATLERTRCYMQRHGMDFWDALWATRAGNVFTTHTPVAAGFDAYTPELLARYGADYADSLGIEREDLLAVGRRNPNDRSEPFSMANLALRTCSRSNGVSRLHGAVSRSMFQDLYPRWPTHEVPIRHVTNGVHVPTWDSVWADGVWTDACGKGRWIGALEAPVEQIETLDDAVIWEMRGRSRRDLVSFARRRLPRQLAARGLDPKLVHLSAEALDPNALTLGFARRFTAYKRPNMLLSDSERLAAMLLDPARPVQIIVAGKAHPRDTEGKGYIRDWLAFVQRLDIRAHAVFLEDYDMAIAQELVHGVDLWVNTPRRPNEACGTSGMKVLVNGGLNLSTRDGWWAEGYEPDVGWSLGDGGPVRGPEHDAEDARELYRLLEEEIVPEFYDRDESGLPRRWIARVRASMSRLAPRFSANRMVREYVDQVYRPAADAYSRRVADEGTLARELAGWGRRVRRHWHELRLGDLVIQPRTETLDFELQVYLADLPGESVQVQLIAEPAGEQPAVCVPMQPVSRIAGAMNSFVYGVSLETDRAPADFTPRVVPFHPEAEIPAEHKHILWWSGTPRFGSA